MESMATNDILKRRQHRIQDLVLRHLDSSAHSSEHRRQAHRGVKVKLATRAQHQRRLLEQMIARGVPRAMAKELVILHARLDAAVSLFRILSERIDELPPKRKTHG
jgi:hypothetical protein